MDEHGGAQERVRWAPVGDTRPQGQLFGDPATRVRHPEFAGMEFIHVRTKRIINEVPAVSRVPFRFTINVYRGCSHACTYCAVGETPVLMADGRCKPLADVRIGDEVYGTERRGRYRRYVTTTVLDRWTAVKAAYRTTLSDGTVLVTSGDHRVLSDRGWKHVTGTGQGARRRPHLTTRNALLGTGGFADPPKHTPEYRNGYLAAWSVCGAEAASADDPEGAEARARVRTFTEIDRAVWPAEPNREWRSGFLAGIYDAEGSYNGGVLRVTNSDPRILAEVAAALSELGFDHVVEPIRTNGCRTVRVRGGLREHVRFFHTVDPAITRKRRIAEGTALKSDADLSIVSVEPLGVDLPMHDLTTGTGDFVTDGVISHNCFARPTHEYLNLDPGPEFERVIVVKVNAVERLQRELRAATWSGEHIAMGTNTDPYQRAEGRYRLTRGVIEELTAAHNPFSILTKSSLVLRDAQLLAEAQRVTDVGVSFSIGTLDNDVWRLTEPGTPHPRSRVEAIATLREHGIASGVLVAPIIPGISDDPAQIDEVVRACVDAGARSISPIVLHLRPGVKELFLPTLAEHRPDLLERYRRLYPRSYAPKQEQERIGAIVRDAVARHRGHTTTPGQARKVRTPPRQRAAPVAAGPPPPTAEQLTLGWDT